MFESLPYVHKFDHQLPGSVVVSKFSQFLDGLDEFLVSEEVLHGEAVSLEGEEGDTHGEAGQDNIIILGDANLHIDWSVLGFKSTKISMEDEISWPYQLHGWTGMALSIPVWWRPYRYAGGHTSYIVMATSIPVWWGPYQYDPTISV